MRKRLPKEDYVVKVFGRLLVKDVIYKKDSRNRNICYFVCECSCLSKNIIEIYYHSVISGISTSCGCYRKERSYEASQKVFVTHNQSKTRLYKIWQGMHRRCYYDSNASYAHYGYRGIIICSQWLHNFKVFYEWAMINGYADNLTIERKDVNGNYCPENCEWITIGKQQRNKNIMSNNKPGVNGVSYYANRKKKYCATIGFNGKQIQLGSYDTLEEASSV